MNLFRTVLGWFRPCQHQYIYLRTVQERNLRAGYEHLSATYKCCKCGSFKIEEIPGSLTR